MATINLLPWREELRKKRQQEFIVTACVAAVLMAGVVGGVHIFYAGKIEYQNRRNQFLQTEITALDKKIEEIKELRKERDRLIARTNVIQQLQSGRPEIVHLFDEVVNTLPEGVYFTSFTQKGRKLSFAGVAQSNARVSSLMRRIEDSNWLDPARLVEIVTNEDKNSGLRLSSFKLSVPQSALKKPDQEEATSESE